MRDGRLCADHDGWEPVGFDCADHILFFFNRRMTTARDGFPPVFKSAEIFRLYDRDYAARFYIALIAFHFEVIPNDLIITMKNSIVDIPFPPLIEAMIMEITIELIREAGIRLPKPISQTIGIVGGLVIGDAVVQAGLISNMMIIVVAVTFLLCASFI